MIFQRNASSEERAAIKQRFDAVSDETRAAIKTFIKEGGFFTWSNARKFSSKKASMYELMAISDHMSVFEEELKQEQEKKKVEAVNILEQVKDYEDFNEEQVEYTKYVLAETIERQSVDFTPAFASYFISSLNAMSGHDHLKTMLNIRLMRRFMEVTTAKFFEKKAEDNAVGFIELVRFDDTRLVEYTHEAKRKSGAVVYCDLKSIPLQAEVIMRNHIEEAKQWNDAGRPCPFSKPDLLTNRHKLLIKSCVKNHDTCTVSVWNNVLGFDDVERAFPLQSMEGKVIGLTPSLMWLRVVEFFNECKKEAKKPAKEKKSTGYDHRQHIAHEEQVQSVKRVNQGIDKRNQVLADKAIGTIRYEITDEGLTITAPNLDKRGIKTSTFIRSYLKKRGVKRIGKTIVDGVIFKPELIPEILSTLGMEQQTLVEFLSELNLPQHNQHQIAAITSIMGGAANDADIVRDEAWRDCA